MGQITSNFYKVFGKKLSHLLGTFNIFGFKVPTLTAANAEAKTMVAVNYHFSRKCNYECGFCFHTEKASYKLPLIDAKRLITLLAEAGCKKLNFAGGEPFLPDHTGRDNYLGEMVKHAKESNIESVSIISNARYVDDKWLQQYGKYLDILGVSCDSADDVTNAQIGRGKKGNHTHYVKKAAELCHKYKIMFKLNTVVNSFNHNEDMSGLINELHTRWGLMRWKLFQVLAVEGENVNNGRGAKRDVAEFLIEKEQFNAYVKRHKSTISSPDLMKIEDNDTMQSSYILIDERGCFLDCSKGAKTPTKPILDVGVSAAFNELTSSSGGGFDQDAFIRRDGIYDWSRSNRRTGDCATGCGGSITTHDIEDLMRN